MSAVSYRYKRVGDVHVPIITMAIRYEDRWYPVEAYVDSGATYSVFTTQVADRLGLVYRTGRRVSLQVGDGTFIPVFLHDLAIQIGTYRLTAPLGFSGKLGVRFNLLGRAGIFSEFKISFDERNYTVAFCPYES